MNKKKCISVEYNVADIHQIMFTPTVL